MENLKRIIQELKQIRTEERLKINDEILFEQAIDIFISRSIQNHKENKQLERATQKQLDLLFKLDVNFNAETITKQEAKELITKELSKKKKGYSH